MSWVHSGTVNAANPTTDENKIKGICHTIISTTYYIHGINGVKSLVKWPKVTLGKKALLIRYMLRTLTFIVKSQSSSSQSKMVP